MSKRLQSSGRPLFSRRKATARKSTGPKRQKTSRKRVKPFVVQVDPNAENTSATRGTDFYFIQKLTDEERAQRQAQLSALEQEIIDNANNLPLMTGDEIDTDDDRLVFARGSIDAALMIIGEAPGAEEAATGRPFVGASGQELDKYLKKNGIDPEKHIYVTNVVLKRPSRNRDPTWEEVTAYAPYLRRHIEIIKPKVILCMGRIASTVVRSGLVSTQSIRGREHRSEWGQHYVESVSLNSLYKQQSNMGALMLREERFCCQCYTAYHPSALLHENTELEKRRAEDPGGRHRAFYRERWEKDFKAVASALLESALEYIDAGELIKETFAPDFKFNHADEIFYAGSQLSEQQQLEYVPPGGSLECEVHSIEYLEYENKFNVFARTADNHSVCLEVSNPVMRFWVGHSNIKKGNVSPSYVTSINSEINEALRDATEQRYKYREMTDLSSATCKLSLTDKRDYIKHNPDTKPYVEVEYYQEDLKFLLKKSLGEVWDKLKFYESSLRPEKQFEYTNDIYIRGWIEVQESSTLRPRTGEAKKSECDLEYTVFAADVRGYSPNPGEAGDAKWERNAPIRTLSLDAEMLNTGGRFPRAEQDPVVSICAYASTSNRTDGLEFTEKIRNPAPGKKTEFKTTGRTNYDDAVAFAVGSVNSIATEKFTIHSLPNVPEPPIEEVLSLKRGVDTDGKYKKSYVVGIRKWNKWLENVRAWQAAVGKRRASRVFNDVELEAAVVALAERPDGADPKKNWTDERILEWESIAQRIRKLWHRRATKDIRCFNEGQSWTRDFEALDFRQREAEFGEIQARWELFRPKKNIFSFKTEEEMLRGFYNYVHQYDADVITGYNISSFDLPYLIRRVEVLDVRDKATNKLISMGRFRQREDQDIIKVSYSKATGERLFHTPEVPGRDCYDFMHYIMRDHKLQSYQLASVAQTFLGDTKNDVPYSAIPSLYRNNRERLNDYCLKDAELVLMLMSYLNNMNFLTALARLIGTISLERLYVDGKQSQVFSCLKRFLCKEGLDKIVPDDNPYSLPEEDGEDGVSYEGAHVFEPKTLGLYVKLLLCLDYASLYPSIIIAYNLGHDMAGTAKHMRKVGVNLDDCFKTPRRFPVPNLRGEELEQVDTELRELLADALASFRLPAEAKLYTGNVVRSQNRRHLVCSVAVDKKLHPALETHLTKETQTSVKIKQDLDENGKKAGTFRIVLDIGQFYYFLQPRKFVKAQLEEQGLVESACRLRPGKPEFFVPQFGDRKRRTRQEIGPYLVEQGLTEEQANAVLYKAEHKEASLEDDERFADLDEALRRLDASPDDCVRHFAEVPDIYLPKRDEAALVGTEQEMLAARKAIKREMEKHKPGSEMYNKLDSQQLALKILCNSLYGATGVKVGKLAGMHISATVTAEGKRSILECSDECAKKFDGDTQGGDTDSIFAHFPSIQRLDQIYEPISVVDDVTGEIKDTTRIDEIVDFANTLVPPPMKIEFEKAYTRFFAVAKKRAALVEHMPYWDDMERCMKFDGKGKISFKGLETKRRDSCLIAQETIKGFLTRLLSEEDSVEVATQKAVEFTRAQVEKVLRGDVPFHQMVQARQLSKKNYAGNLPHVEICEKKRKRGQPVPELGSRIPFVVVTGSKGRKFYQSVEDPDYALEHNMQLDYMYIIEKKIAAPVKRFTQFMDNTEGLNNAIFGNLRKVHRKNLQEDDPIAQFVRELQPCIGCGQSSPQIVCSDCGPGVDWNYLWNQEITARCDIDERLESAMKTCRACMHIEEHEEVLCANMSCSEYFPRRGSEYEQKRQDVRIQELNLVRASYGVDIMDMDW